MNAITSSGTMEKTEEGDGIEGPWCVVRAGLSDWGQRAGPRVGLGGLWAGWS